MAYRLLVVVAFACAALAVSFQIYDPDLWQHLTVGRAIWTLHRIPHEHLWTWPSYGQPDLLPSWLFRVLLWPVYAAAGFWGIQSWRWITTLGSFALLLATSRRMGARGLLTLAVLVICALSERSRTLARPETLVAVMFAFELWLLETRRRGGRDLAVLLVPLLWAWVNVHISYPIGFVIAGTYLVGDAIEARRSTERRRPALRLAWTLVIAACLVPVNPFGLRAAWAPFEFALRQSKEPLFQTIEELRPLMWSQHLTDGLPLLVVGWPVLAFLRPGRRPVDPVEWILMVGFTWQAIASRRFVLYYALAALPFVSAHLEAWARTWKGGPPRSLRAALVLGTACLALSVIEASSPLMPFGLRFDFRLQPVDAADFMRDHGVRGHGFNYYYQGGYLLWRFWPDTTRLPFMDIHQSGTEHDRFMYSWSLIDPVRWQEHDRERRFDYLLLRTPYTPQDRLLDFVDADSSTWALVFLDDASAIYVRRGGRLQAVADSFEYRLVRATPEGTQRLGAMLEADPARRAAARREFERAASSSARSATAHSMLANIALIDHRLDDARRELATARTIVPGLPRVDERLGIIALLEGRPEEALEHFTRERRHGVGAGIEFRMGQAWSALGRRAEARDAYAREVAAHPDWPGARDSLAALDRGSAR